jgi:hypothetical protein
VVSTVEERQNARVIIFGHSWGGSAAISLARKVEKDKIGVLLTVQVDSISKIHRDDSVIPANVGRLFTATYLPAGAYFRCPEQSGTT